MATVIKGSEFVLSIDLDGDGVGTHVMMGCATSSTLSIAAEYSDASCKGSGGWKEGTSGAKSWNMSTDALYRIGADVTGIDLFDLMTAGTKVSVRMGETTSGGTYYQGDAYITQLDFNSPEDGNATLTCTFEGTGPIAKATVA